jgi:hypothetical protein
MVDDDGEERSGEGRAVVVGVWKAHRLLNTCRKMDAPWRESTLKVEEGARSRCFANTTPRSRPANPR